MVETLIVVFSSLWIGEDLVGFQDVLKKARALRAYSVWMVPFRQFPECLSNAALTFRARYSQNEVIVLCRHGVLPSPRTDWEA